MSVATTPLPPKHLGLRHIAFHIQNLEASEKFYTQILGFKIVWQPDDDNIYLSSGSDNLALHRAKPDANFSSDQRLDHFGFFLAKREEVDSWHDYLAAHHCDIKLKPKDHRDGTRSFYVADPDGNIIQFIYYPI